MITIRCSKAAEVWDILEGKKDDTERTKYIKSHWLHIDGTVSSKWRVVRFLEKFPPFKCLHRSFCNIDHDFGSAVLTSALDDSRVKRAFDGDVQGAISEIITKSKNKEERELKFKTSIHVYKTCLLYSAFEEHIKGTTPELKKYKEDILSSMDEFSKEYQDQTKSLP